MTTGIEQARQLDAAGLFGVWLGEFGAAVESGDVDAILGMLVPDEPHWRDFLGLTWDFETYTGHAAIATALRRYLDHHGLLQHFDGWSFSDEVGCYKPDPRIFAHARDSLGVDASVPMAHVGDLRRTDVAGARRSGWRSVRYRGFYDDDSELAEADVVIAAHSELVGALGIA